MRFYPILCTAAAALLHAATLSAQPYAQRDECTSAKLILTHEPGEEIFPGNLHPAAALFEDYLDKDRIVAEHCNYRRELEKAGARVMTVREILLERTTDKNGHAVEGEQLNRLRSLADSFLTYDVSGIDSGAAAEQEAYRQSVIRSASPEDLVRIILLQPRVRLLPTKTNTGQTATYAFNPVMNLFYMRDQMITTAKGTVIGRMNSPQREQECNIAAFCLDKIGNPAIHRISGDGAYLEGGDFYPFGNVAFIGCGMRTTQPAIDQLMERGLLGCDTLVVVKDRLFSQAQMHLDTYFNIIDRDLVTLATERMTTDPTTPEYLAADVYVRGAEGYMKAEKDTPFVQLLARNPGMEIIPISIEDRERLANNFLTVAPRRIMAVEGQSEQFQAAMRDKGVRVVWLPLENLRKGYGAAHCMTQVLSRE